MLRPFLLLVDGTKAACSRQYYDCHPCKFMVRCKVRTDANELVVTDDWGEIMGKLDGKVLAQNRKAYHDYFIEETLEAGIVLLGTEIKSIRRGSANLRDAYAQIENGELWLHNMHVSPYEQGNRFNHEPMRSRKLLLHRSEIAKLIGTSREKGYTLVPTKVYLRNGFCKVEIGLAKGKKLHDKREAMKKRDAAREIDRALRDRQKS